MPADPPVAMDDLAARVWDAVVIGGGPAGAVAGILLARRGWSVLLLERSSWPRDKVCGGCAGPFAIRSLEELNLLTAVVNARPLSESHLIAGHRSASLPTTGYAISRAELDANLIAQFITAGGRFVAHANARLLADDDLEYRGVSVRVGTDSSHLRARCVIAADGIAGRSLDAEPWAAWQVDRHSHIGVSATLQTVPAGIESGGVHMHVGDAGYVGVVRFADGTAHLAAALSPAACRATGGPAKLIAAIGESCGRVFQIDEHSVRGTPALTRHRRRIAGHRVIAVGDACGYVEPFTGEGIGWAIASGRAAVELLPDRPSEWPDHFAGRWRRAHDEVISRQQQFCRVVRSVVRHPAVLQATIGAFNLWPALARWAAGNESPHAVRGAS